MGKYRDETDGRKRELLFLLVHFLFCVATAILGVLCLANAKGAFFIKRFVLLSALIGLGSLLLFGFSAWFLLSGKKTLAKSVFSLYVLLACALSLCLLLQKTGFFEVVKSSERLQEYLERMGAWTPVLYVLLQFLQVIILPIPSFVSTVAGVALFGALRAFLYSVLGILVGSILAFFIGRKLGFRAVSWIVGDETLEKWRKKLKGKDDILLTFMFLFPLFPDDVLCFIAGLSSMTVRYFLIMITIARGIGIAGTCFSVDMIPVNRWWGIALWIVLLASIALSFCFVYKNLDKIQARLRKERKNKKN